MWPSSCASAFGGQCHAVRRGARGTVLRSVCSSLQFRLQKLARLLGVGLVEAARWPQGRRSFTRPRAGGRRLMGASPEVSERQRLAAAGAVGAKSTLAPGDGQPKWDLGREAAGPDHLLSGGWSAWANIGCGSLKTWDAVTDRKHLGPTGAGVARRRSGRTSPWRSSVGVDATVPGVKRGEWGAWCRLGEWTHPLG